MQAFKEKNAQLKNLVSKMDQESENGDSAALLSQRQGTLTSARSYQLYKHESPEVNEGCSDKRPPEKETTFGEEAEPTETIVVSALKKPPPSLKLETDVKDM